MPEKPDGTENVFPDEIVEIDGPNHPFSDSLLDGLVGRWNVTGKIAGQSIRHFCEAEWVLYHQFLRVHFIDVEPRRPKDQRDKKERQHAPYEAIVFVGYDFMSERYVIHWLDIFGGRFSENLGFGKRENDEPIKFVFEYRSGPLHNTFTRNADKDGWSVFIEQKDEKGKLTVFASEVLERTKSQTPQRR
jgi:hypothetical protein